MRPGSRLPDEIWSGLLGGLLSGLVGALIFAAAHAVLIVPIWTRMGSGLGFGALAGAGAGWALAENYPGYLDSPAGEAALIGARFGAVLWLLATPVTGADVLLRAVGIAPRFELVAVGVALVLALGGGAAFGWHRTHRRRGMIAGAVATLALTLAMAGPVPIARSPRAFGIFVAVLPAAALAGAVLALLARWLHRLRNRRLIGSVPPAVVLALALFRGATDPPNFIFFERQGDCISEPRSSAIPDRFFPSRRQTMSSGPSGRNQPLSGFHLRPVGVRTTTELLP